MPEDSAWPLVLARRDRGPLRRADRRSNAVASPASSAARSRSRAGTSARRRGDRHDDRRGRAPPPLPRPRRAAAVRLVGHRAPDRDRDDAVPAPASRRTSTCAPRRPGAWPPAPLADPKIAQAAARDRSCSSRAASRSSLAGRSARPEDRAAACGLALAPDPRPRVPRVPGAADPRLARSFRPHDNAYGSIYYTLIGVHPPTRGRCARSLAGRSCALARASLRSGISPLQRASLYWLFVIVVAVVVFLTLYIAPRG